MLFVIRSEKNSLSPFSPSFLQISKIGCFLSRRTIDFKSSSIHINMSFNFLQIILVSSTDRLLSVARDINFFPRKTKIVSTNNDNISSNKVNALLAV
ncbi:MAG: hypothetical protein LBK24_02150 [Puniceicoccales bacterium]|nr:hypothetical protein [Puniceicoccales bacterium]